MSPTGCSITLLVVKPHKKISAFLLVPFFYFFFWTLNKTWQAIVFLLLSFHLLLILSSRVYCFRPKILGFFITNSKFHNSSKDCMYILTYTIVVYASAIFRLFCIIGSFLKLTWELPESPLPVKIRWIIQMA